jgi:hypothetical protein
MCAGRRSGKVGSCSQEHPLPVMSGAEEPMIATLAQQATNTLTDRPIEIVFVIDGEPDLVVGAHANGTPTLLFLNELVVLIECHVELRPEIAL